MNRQVFELIGRLASEHRLAREEYRFLIDHRTDEAAAYLSELAVKARKEIYGDAV